MDNATVSSLYYITPDLLAHYRIKVITMVPYSKAHSKGKVHKNRQNRKEAQPSEFSINGTTEKQHIPDLVQAFLLTTVIQVGGLTHHFLGECLYQVGNMTVVF
jgi:hypothetical protein